MTLGREGVQPAVGPQFRYRARVCMTSDQPDVLNADGSRKRESRLGRNRWLLWQRIDRNRWIGARPNKPSRHPERTEANISLCIRLVLEAGDGVLRVAPGWLRHADVRSSRGAQEKRSR